MSDECLNHVEAIKRQASGYYYRASNTENYHNITKQALGDN